MPDPPKGATEEEKVLYWREQQFLDMDFTMSQAAALAADVQVDLREVQAWRKNGCQTDTACRLAGVDVKEEELVVVPQDPPRIKR